MQKKRHLINGKSLVVVTYKKGSKSNQESSESTESGDRSSPTWGPEDSAHIQSPKN